MSRDEILFSHRPLNRGAQGYTFAKRQYAGIRGKIELDRSSPIRHDEQVHISDRELVAKQISVPDKMLFQVSEAAVEAPAENCLHGCRDLTLEQWTEAAQLQLGRDEVQPRLELCSFECAIGGSEVLFGHAVTDVLRYGDSFGQDGAIPELQGWNVTQGMDTSIVAAAVDGLGVLIDLDGVEGEPCFNEDDVRKKGACTG